MASPGSPKLEDNELFLRQHDHASLDAWIKKAHAQNYGIKQVPPLEIIEFEDLIPIAWNTARLVPWSCAIVHFEDYMEYLKNFFKKNPALHCDPRAAAVKCLEMETMYIGNHDVHDDNLSVEINNVAEKIKNEGTFEGDSAVVAAGLVCIGVEAKLMSKLLASDTKMLKFSNEIRLCVLRMLAYKGPESHAIAGAMLDLSQEAKKLRRLVYKGDAKSFAKLRICISVRRSTLCFLDQLRQFFISESTVNGDVNASNNTKRELNSDEAFISESTVNGDVNASNNTKRELNSDEAFVENEKKKRKEK